MNRYKRLLVTGGASGLGRELAIKWASHGADIGIADINQERGEQVVEEIKQLGVNAFYQTCDITNQEHVSALKDRVEQLWQGVDLVINNAGIASADSLDDESIEQWRQVLEINLLGAVKMTKVFTPLFRQQGHGHFLNIASQAGITPIPKMASYNASKAALVSFSETMRLELVDDNIQVSVMCPGFFQTNLKESLKTNSTRLAEVLDKMMARSQMTAAHVASRAFKGVNNNEFLILTHKEGKRVFRLKRWFPKYYLKMMTKQTARLRSKNTAKDK